MKSLLRKAFIAILLVFIIPHTHAVEPFTVRVIYFQPTNAPAPPATLQDTIEQVQQFYGNEMERYGYGYKTFRLERDADNDIVINHVNGKHNTWHYSADTYGAIEKELPFEFIWDNVDSQDRIHIIIAGGLNLIDNRAWGIGWPILGWRSGGNGVVAGGRSSVSIIAHELGHAFGLYHTDVPNALMGPGDDVLLDYEVRWLDNHHYFNDVHIRTDIPVFVANHGILSFDATDEKAASLTFKMSVRSNSGLYQSQLCRSRNVFVLGSDELTGNDDIIEVNTERWRVTNGEGIYFQIMDVNGNFIHEYIRTIKIPETQPRPDTPRNKNPDLNVPEEPKEVEEEVIDPCPNCMPDDKDVVDNNPDLSIHVQNKLTTQWAQLKIGR